MAQITAKDVAALRAKTGLGMMDCKKALVEAEGDVEAAVKILREKGGHSEGGRYHCYDRSQLRNRLRG